MSLENQHIHLRQQVQSQIVEIVNMREQLRHAFQCSNNTIFRDGLISTDAKLTSFNQAISAIDSRVSVISSNTVGPGSPDKSSGKDSDASIESQIGGVPQSRNNSIQSNNSGRSLLHDSGVSDLGKVHPLEEDILLAVIFRVSSKAYSPTPYRDEVY
jgi:hypothetical protein